MTKKAKIIADNFDLFLKDFTEDTKPRAILVDLGQGRKMVQEFRIDLPTKLDIRKPFIVFIIFVYLKKFRFIGKGEKVAWEIPIKYKGTPFILTHRKFGFRIISIKDSSEIRKIGIEAMEQIQKAIPYAETLIEPHIHSQVKKGAITLDNEYEKIWRRYKFFRGKAASEFKKTERKAKEEKSEYVWPSDKAGYFTTAMLDSYFSLLEHLFVLVFPFISTIKHSDYNIEEFIGLNWKEKYKIILPITTNVKALQLLEKLEKVKEIFRNPLSHGYFLKNGHSFLVHLEHLGAIPMVLTNRTKKINYRFQFIDNLSFQEICDCFDEFDLFMKKDELTKYGVKFIKKGLPVAFNTETIKMYNDSMTSDKNFNEFIWHIMRAVDDAGNMDW